MHDLKADLHAYFDELASAAERAVAEQPVPIARGSRRPRLVLIAACSAAVVFLAGVAMVVRDRDDDLQGVVTAPDDATGALEIAGEIGPGGGVMNGGREMQSTPEEMFSYQPDGATVVYDATEGNAASNGYYVTAQRYEGQLCVRLSEAGKAPPVAERCNVPAYATPEEVSEPTYVARGTISTDHGDQPMVYGVTYLDAATVTTPDGSAVAQLSTGHPFWMHNFFALPIAADTTEVLILDAAGREISRAPIPIPCPDSVVRRVDGGDPVADALPPVDGAVTDRAAAVEAFERDRDALRDRYGATSVELGDGFGRAWTGTNGQEGVDYNVVDVDDFGILVTLPSQNACPSGSALHVRSDSGLPLFFFAPTHSS